MDLFDLGLTNEHSQLISGQDFTAFTVGRVTQEHRERYTVSTGENEFDAEITGNLRFTANSRADFPAVGDWVKMTVNENLAFIHKILPRKSILERQTVGITGEKQIIASNVDFAFIMQSIDFNFNINRLERYLTICYSSDIDPVLIISKIDLSSQKEINQAIESLKKRDRMVKYILLSNSSKKGLDQILSFLQKGKTYCIVGSSGVGKSTLINNLLNRDIQETKEISNSTNKGKHTTARRELFVLDNGAILIDTPGMKELGIADNLGGIQTTFQDIHNLALSCKYPDCKHINEKGCAVLNAMEKGNIDRASLENYQKMIREQERFQSTIAEKRKKDKQFGKMAKEVLKEKKKNKF